MAARVHLELPARPASLPGVHGAVAGLEAPELGDEGRGDLALLAVELVTNAMRHSGSTEPVGLDVTAVPGAVRIEVRDRGPGFDPDPGTPTLRQVGGRGLFLVEQLADRWGYAHDGDGFLVWAELWTGGHTRHRRVPPRMLALGDAVDDPPEPPVPGDKEIAALPDAVLKDELNLLAEDERRVSARRRRLHAHIDAMRREVARRLSSPRTDAILSEADLAELARLLAGRMPPAPRPAGDDR
jgi:hypothetical protein